MDKFYSTTAILDGYGPGCEIKLYFWGILYDARQDINLGGVQ